MNNKRFYGVYRGICVDSQDPDGLGRITVQVPQILGAAISNWAPNMGGQIAQYKMPYGTFQTTTNQSLTQNAITIVNNWAEDDVNSVYLNGTKLYVEETGDYFFQFSAVFNKATASSGKAEIWIRKNGVDVPNTNTITHLSGSDAETVTTVGFILDLDAGDYLELAMYTSSTNVSLKYYSASTSPARPVMPGVIATLNLIGKYKPKPGTPVWVSFIDGDPNFPVWIGAY